MSAAPFSRLLRRAGRPWVLAHRGWSARFPENTLPAIQGAVAVGADAVEVDVRLSRDGVPVLHHDEDLRRTADRPERIADLDAEQLRRVDVGAGSGPQHAGVGIPTLEEVFDLLDGRVPLDLELKEVASPAHGDRLVECVARLVREYRVEDCVAVSSFEPSLLERMRRRSPELPRGRLVDPDRDRGRPLGPLAGEAECAFLGVSLADTSGERLDEAVSTGLPVFVFTVDDPAVARELHRRGAAGVFTNVPDLLASELEAG